MANFNLDTIYQQLSYIVSKYGQIAVNYYGLQEKFYIAYDCNIDLLKDLKQYCALFDFHLTKVNAKEVAISIN